MAILKVYGERQGNDQLVAIINARHTAARSGYVSTSARGQGEVIDVSPSGSVQAYGAPEQRIARPTGYVSTAARRSEGTALARSSGYVSTEIAKRSKGGEEGSEVEKKMPWSAALWEFVKYKGLGPFVDVYSKTVDGFVNFLRNRYKVQGIEVTLPSAENSARTVAFWRSSMQEKLGKDIVIGAERHSLRVQSEADQRAAMALGNGWVEYPGPMTLEEGDVATQMFEEWIVTGDYREGEALLKKLVTVQYQDIINNKLRAGTSMGYGNALSIVQRYGEVRQSPIIFHTDARTAAWIVGKKDKKQAEGLRRQTWSILPSGIYVNNPDIKELQKRHIPWQLISLPGQPPSQNNGSEIIEIIPEVPEFINVLQTSGPQQLRPEFQKIFKDVGGLLVMNSLAERSGQRGDRLPILPVRHPTEILKQMLLMKNLWYDLHETLNIADEMIGKTEARVGKPLRPKVIRAEFARMQKEGVESQVRRAQQMLPVLRKGLTTINKSVHGLQYMALERKIAKIESFLRAQKR